MSKIYDNIKALATTQGLSINEVTRRSGLSQGQINRWRTASPNVDALASVATTLHTTVDQLLGRANPNISKDLSKILANAQFYDGRELSDAQKAMVADVLESVLKERE